MPDLAEEIAALRRRVDALEAIEAQLRKRIWELQRQARTPGFNRGITPIKVDE